MRLLIDGDILVYRAGYAIEKTLYSAVKDGQTIETYPEGTTITSLKKKYKGTKLDFKIVKEKIPEPVENALQVVKAMINTMQEHAQAFFKESCSCSVYITSEDHSNFRFKVAKTYKANRTQPKPIYYNEIRTYLKEVCYAQEVFGKEADDELGLQQTRCAKEKVRSCIVSIDKDLRQVPGWHFNFVTGEFRKITPKGYLKLEEKENGRKCLSGGGLIWFYAQMLKGDIVDNVPGIDGYGDVKIFNLLKTCKTEEEMFDKVQKVYYKYHESLGTGEEEMNEVATLLWIQQTDRIQWR